MDPKSLDDYLAMSPMPVLRLTLSSGDQLLIAEGDRAFTEGLTLIVPGGIDSGRFRGGPPLVSIPNIALVEPVGDARPRRRSR